MRLATSWALWLLAGAPVLVALLVGAAFAWRRAVKRFGDEASVRRLLLGVSPSVRIWKAIVLVSGVVLALVAFSRPQFGGRTKMLRRRGIDVVVAMDFSKSMLARDVYPSRIELAKREVEGMLRDLGGDRVGLVAFAGETMSYPLTTDATAAALFLRDLHPNDMPVGGTAIGRALVASQRIFEGDSTTGRRTKVVILLTDGEDHEGEPVQAAEQLAQAGVQVHVLAIGSGSSEPIPQYAEDGSWLGYMRDPSTGAAITSRLSPEGDATLRQIANVTHGHYFRARPGQVGLEQVRRQLANLKRAELKARRVTIYDEVYDWFLLPAFILLLLEASLPDGFRRRARAPVPLAKGSPA
jgi:Ca-activated chloride channel family protein